MNTKEIYLEEQKGLSIAEKVMLGSHLGLTEKEILQVLIREEENAGNNGNIQ